MSTGFVSVSGALPGGGKRIHISDVSGKVVVELNLFVVVTDDARRQLVANVIRVLAEGRENIVIRPI
jgi:hypothetical protein